MATLDLGQVRGTQGSQGIQGQQGLQGPAGTNGANGTDGLGVPRGGTTGQYLKKASSADNDTTWASFANATQQAAGMMSQTDKKALDELSVLTVASDIETQEAMDSQMTTWLTAMAENSIRWFCFSSTAAIGILPAGRKFIILEKGLANIYGKAIITASGSQNIYTAHKTADGWSYEKYKAISGDTAKSVMGTGTIESIASGSGSTCQIDVAIPEGYKYLTAIARATTSGLMIVSVYQTTQDVPVGYVRVIAYVWNQTGSSKSSENVTVNVLFVPV